MTIRPYDPMPSRRKRLAQTLAAAVLAVLTAFMAVRAWRLVAGFVRGVAELIQSWFA